MELVKQLFRFSGALLATALAASLCAPAFAADKPPAATAAPSPAAPPPPATADAVSHHTMTLAGKSLAYTARAGTLTLRDDKGEATARIYYTAFTLDGGAANRPVTFFYNGGPGSSTMWLLMGSFSPVLVETKNGALTGPPPYSIVPNQDTLLDASDLVFIDMPGTGFGRIVGKGTPKMFFGVDADVEAFAQFIQRYITKFGRWNSPKFLYGESYGTTRSAALANYLEQNGISLNGVVLQSSYLNAGVDDTYGNDDNGYILYLPSEAAAAWYHHALPGSWPSLSALVSEVDGFALGEYSDALAKGDRVSKSEYDDVVAKLHRYTGLTATFIRNSNLRIPYDRFDVELFRNQGTEIGRLDSRFQTHVLDRYRDTPAWDATDAAIDSAFTTAVNQYLRVDLGYDTKLPYKGDDYDEIYGNGGSWDSKHNGNVQTNVAPDLAKAMTFNPSLQVFSANGYFDFATPFFETQYVLDHLRIDPSLEKNITYGFYQSGHMIYLNPQAHARLHDDLERWYAATLGGR